MEDPRLVICQYIDQFPTLEKIYRHAEYPGKSVVDEVVKCMRLNYTRSRFVEHFYETDIAKVPNLEWYLEHIAMTMERYNQTSHIEYVYEWM